MDTQVLQTRTDDPRRLRELMERAVKLAQEHELRSVLVGLSGYEGDPAFPEIVEFVESELRVDDSIFRMTRERVVLLLTDVDAEQANSIVARVLEDFRERLPASSEPAVGVDTFEVAPGTPDVTVKHVLPLLFASPPKPH